MFNIFSKLIDSNEKELGRLNKTVVQVNALEGKYKKLTDRELSGKAEEFRKQVKNGKSLDEILPEVFAAVREAGGRTVKMRLFDVQIMAGIVLHQGKIAEQKTGEGKTLSAIPALFLNSLSGEGVHLVTVNDYLAQRDCGWMGPIFHALGATCATIIHEQAFIYDPKFKNTEHDDPRLKHLKPVSRKEAYNADITYGTNNEFGFDFLRDNMAFSLADQAQKGHSFAIVDEVDSILIDEARTPLIISRPAQEPTKKYYEFAQIIEKLSPDTDFVIDEKQRTANLTEHGTLKIEKILGVENLYEKNFSTLHHVEEALKARALFQKDKDYVVKNGEVIIVDEFTGRLMPGRRYSEGLHQAIEAKEEVEIQQESQTLATISFQNYFRMYRKLSGMTGTAATEAEEFHKIYKLDVVSIPTHMPMVREDLPDLIFKTQTAKYTAVANEIEDLHKKGQPVLVGTTSIDKNEFLSELLKRKGISHALLNAKNHEKEAEIISHAGENGAVTVATNMAGRGVDIKLEKGDRLGGLFVLGTERHESRRIDNQLRGRSGRQGDQGASRFFLSLEDDLMRIFGGEQVAKVMNLLKMPEDTPIENPMVSRAIEGAQKKVEGHNFDIRKTTVEYDDVANQQRQIIYGVRKKVLEAAANLKESTLKQDILQKIGAEITRIVEVNTLEGLDVGKIVEEFTTIINFDPNSTKAIEKEVATIPSAEKISEFLSKLAHDLYEEREKNVGVEIARQMEVFVFLNTIDTLWIEHLDTMDDLRAGIGLRGYGQRDPLIEYKKEAFELFSKLVANIDFEIVHRIYKIAVQQGPQVPQPIQVEEKHPEIEVGVEQEAREIGVKIQEKTIPPDFPPGYAGTKVTIERAGQVVAQETYGEKGQLTKSHGKVGRNDPCWCGSGKKYKKCHYPN
ncbi:preprotein translocase subunit SecA [Candidatus Daviesbacteria bacterium RIFOXYD1_FULL_41_10]|uniref:Protein translocase subunit SecA n=2 Tax=Candidatus Daviesiibacteriota TaxID=1752718 RepID=A0A1F5N1E6_9BACT|nr:MAG: Protein translocase subunit SecA [Candidatus Daviesbacteria bacterium GW2011_GWB1_41_5]OGE71403.1 MAG: preprotein translocase subunit SecA [Candidatus Daviesbacteria bacterium RIFOXYD1_FULL_41_10]